MDKGLVGPNSAARRQQVLRDLGLPEHLTGSKKNWMITPMVSSVMAQLMSLPYLLALSAARSILTHHALRSAPLLVP